MIPLVLFIGILIIAALASWFGWELYKKSHPPAGDPHEIHKYIMEEFPDEFTAYQKGVREGYTQGLRDGQDPPL